MKAGTRLAGAAALIPVAFILTANARGRLSSDATTTTPCLGASAAPETAGFDVPDIVPTLAEAIALYRSLKQQASSSVDGQIVAGRIALSDLNKLLAKAELALVGLPPGKKERAIQVIHHIRAGSLLLEQRRTDDPMVTRHHVTGDGSLGDGPDRRIESLIPTLKGDVEKLVDESLTQTKRDIEKEAKAIELLCRGIALLYRDVFDAQRELAAATKSFSDAKIKAEAEGGLDARIHGWLDGIAEDTSTPYDTFPGFPATELRPQAGGRPFDEIERLRNNELELLGILRRHVADALLGRDGWDGEVERKLRNRIESVSDEDIRGAERRLLGILHARWSTRADTAANGNYEALGDLIQRLEKKEERK